MIATLGGRKGHDKKVEAIKKIMENKSLKHVIEDAGFINKTDKKYICMSEIFANTKRFFSSVTSTKKPRGRSIDDKRSEIETLQSAMKSTTAIDPNIPKKLGD